MRTDEFDYELPEELIAQVPAERRDESRMLVIDRETGTLTHTSISRLPDYLRQDDVIVLNNTRVIPARLFGKKADTGGKIEVLLLEPVRVMQWMALCRASRAPKVGAQLLLGDGRIRAEVLSCEGEGKLLLNLECDGDLDRVLESIGEMPLPPYIRREGGVTSHQDRERYQTVYASRLGAVAAPTAGLHFTPALLDKIEKQGVKRAELTLHVGIGTFRPVATDQVEDHQMHSERYELTEADARVIAGARESGGRIVAVGSTSVRTLETIWREHGRIKASSGRSDIFIYPPYTFRAVDAMLTNFHLPKSSLLMMVSALAGRDLIRQAYQEAIERHYRFFSYGDAMLII